MAYPNCPHCKRPLKNEAEEPIHVSTILADLDAVLKTNEEKVTLPASRSSDWYGDG